MHIEAGKTGQILEYLFTPYNSFNTGSENKAKKEHNKNSTKNTTQNFNSSILPTETEEKTTVAIRAQAASPQQCKAYFYRIN